MRLAAYSDAAPPVDRALLRRIASERPDLVLFCGDAVERDSGRRWRTHLWRRSLAKFAGRVLAVPGNHDYDSHGNLDDWRDDLVALQSPVEPAPRWCHDVGDLRILGLSSGHRDHRVADDDLHWAIERLKTACGVGVVALHEPPFPVASHIGSSLDVHREARDQLVYRLSGAGAKLLLCGHEHLYARRRVTTSPELWQLILGGGGAPLEAAAWVDSVVAQTVHHYAIISVTTGIEVRVMSLAGEMIDRFFVS